MNSAREKPVIWNGQGLEEYLLVLNPGEIVHKKIMNEKLEFYTKYGERIAVKTLPHISVASFLGKESMEETLIRWIQRVCDQQKTFEITLNNYSGFPAHTIYLRVQDASPFRRFVVQLKAIDNFIRSSGCPPLHVKYNPHMTIARRLSAPVFSRALTDYSQKLFHESFLAEELVLLRRSHQFDACKKINVFHFKP